MLRIGKLTDYAMLIMGELAKDPDGILSAAFLAETLHLTSPTVSKILKILAEANLVSSVRGAEGGYRLARGAAAISIADILQAMEGQVAMTECCETAGACAIDTSCTMRGNWRRINQVIQVLFSKFTLLDMLQPLSPLKVLEELSHGK